MARGSIRGHARSRNGALRVAFSWIAVGSLWSLLATRTACAQELLPAPPDFERPEGGSAPAFGSTPLAPEVAAKDLAHPDVSGDLAHAVS